MPHRDTPLPSLVAHADWSKDPRKRWCATAVRAPDRRYRAESAEPVGDLGTYFDRLRQRAGGGSVLAGFDFPIGLPRRYAANAGLSDFRSALAGFGHGRWRDFYQPAETKAAITITRPFYPGRLGGTKRADLVEKLGARQFDDLLRRCDRAPGRRAAAAMFWLVGGNQVGKAAITGWRDLITPAVERDPALSLWPFDGRLAVLLARPGVVIAETYPGEAYGHLDLTIRKPDRSKRRQADRMADRHALRNWARTNHVLLADRLQASIDSGFGADAAGEDCFDAVVGLFGMLDVVLGNRPAGEPEDDVTKIEGWILGQQAPTATATGPGRRRPTA